MSKGASSLLPSGYASSEKGTILRNTATRLPLPPPPNYNDAEEDEERRGGFGRQDACDNRSDPSASRGSTTGVDGSRTCRVGVRASPGVGVCAGAGVRVRDGAGNCC
jgi:hypothetical protein